MSSEEDFSLVTEPSTLEEMEDSITNYKKMHEQLLQEQKELAVSRDELKEMAEQFRHRTKKLTQSLEEDQRSYKEKLESEKARLNAMMQEEDELIKEIQKVQAALEEEEALNIQLKKKAGVFTAVPERSVVFKGSTGKPTAGQTFDMEPRIVYPMEEGTALITFEEELVAKKILSMKSHKVDLGGECSIMVEARPVQLMLPRVVEIESEVCPQRILISNLPKMDSEILMNKLEIHFSKTKNGGGEVDCCEMMFDSWTVVLTFVQGNIAKGLADMEHHEVKLQQKKHKVRVTPFINGNIANLKAEMTACPRVVLLTGIPAIMERDTLQDLLEIHFQKSCNGGGEIEAFLYNPVGEHTSAVFDGVSSDDEDEEEEEE